MTDDKSVNFFSTVQTRGFLLLWLGQFMSVIGSGMTSFVMAVWAYQLSQSIRTFSTIVLAAALPAILIGPFAGMLVDRWNKRTVLFVSVIGQALSTAVLAFLFATGRLQSYWQVYPAVIAVAACASFQGPALIVVASRLLPAELYSRSSGLWQLHQAAVMIVSPMLAVALMPLLGIAGVIYFDAASYVFAILSLCLVAIPAITLPVSADAQVRHPVRNFLIEISAGWAFVRHRSALLQLLIVQIGRNIVYGLVQILIFPLGVRGDSSVALAALMASSACGMVVGSVAMATWSGPAKQINGVMLSGVVVGLALLFAGPQQNQWWLSAALFCVTLFIPLGLSSSSAIWLRKTPSNLLGRVTALNGALIQLCFPVACLIAPGLSDAVFHHISGPRGVLAGSAVISLFGAQSSRSVGPLLSILGSLTLLTSVAFWLSPALRHLERNLPDRRDDDTVALETPVVALLEHEQPVTLAAPDFTATTDLTATPARSTACAAR